MSVLQITGNKMSIRSITLRFTSGNIIPIDKAVIPAVEWNVALDEVKQLLAVETQRAARYETLLAEASHLFRAYEKAHRALGLDHQKKAERNAEIAKRIEEAVLDDNFIVQVNPYLKKKGIS